MKVGTDGVLLGAWTETSDEIKQVLDIGTGTGLIALMLAQRIPGADVMGVVIEEVSQARENADASPWSARVNFRQIPVQEFRPDKSFDLIVSNPPFFVDSLTCPDPGRTQARHTVSLPFEALRDAVVRLLAPGGHFSLILPSSEAERFIVVCGGKLRLSCRTDVRTRPGIAPKRALLTFVHDDGCPPATADTLTIGTGEHESYTPEYQTLTRDFYLKF